MPQMTVAGVRKYTAASHRREIRDSLAVGLYLIIQPKPSGAKSWAMRFRRPDGRSAKLTLGRVDLSQDETADAPQLGGALTLRQARQLANEIDRRRARGQDVIAEHAAAKHSQRQAAQRRGANTFEVAAREFFTARSSAGGRSCAAGRRARDCWASSTRPIATRPRSSLGSSRAH